ncbi:MAG: hypothetical protein HW399_912, partial [Dehalococcoidia bacterium]|nr:hypothetical protein [Dehalococcoidia bacterium]
RLSEIVILERSEESQGWGRFRAAFIDYYETISNRVNLNIKQRSRYCE